MLFEVTELWSLLLCGINWVIIQLPFYYEKERLSDLHKQTAKSGPKFRTAPSGMPQPPLQHTVVGTFTRR